MRLAAVAALAVTLASLAAAASAQPSSLDEVREKVLNYQGNERDEYVQRMKGEKAGNAWWGPKGEGGGGGKQEAGGASNAPSNGEGGFKIKRAVPKAEPEPESPPGLETLLQGLDWGTMHDPHDKFCGKFDCYKILGFTYDDRFAVTSKDITKNYRALSRKYHPDKLTKAQRDAGHSEKLFAYIAKAYEVLLDEERKMSYDYYFKASPEEYTRAFGNSVTGFKYAPKSSAVLVVIGALAFCTVIGWFIRKSKYDQIKRHVVLAAVHDLSLTNGGGRESIYVRKLCVEYADKLKDAACANDAAGANNTPSSGKKGKKDKNGSKQAPRPSAGGEAAEEGLEDEAALLTKLSEHFNTFKPSTKHLQAKEYEKELQKYCYEPFCNIIAEHVYSDFGGGFRKPKVPDDLLPYILAVFFFATLPKSIYKNARWHYRRSRKLPYDSDEVLWLTTNTMGLRWDLLNEDQKKNCLERKIWEEGALEKWDFEQEVALYGEKKARKMKEWREKKASGEDMGDY